MALQIIRRTDYQRKYYYYPGIITYLAYPLPTEVNQAISYLLKKKKDKKNNQQQQRITVNSVNSVQGFLRCSLRKRLL